VHRDVLEKINVCMVEETYYLGKETYLAKNRANKALLLGAKSRIWGDVIPPAKPAPYIYTYIYIYIYIYSYVCIDT
jgi:hypothetical protein